MRDSDDFAVINGQKVISYPMASSVTSSSSRPKRTSHAGAKGVTLFIVEEATGPASSVAGIWKSSA